MSSGPAVWVNDGFDFIAGKEDKGFFQQTGKKQKSIWTFILKIVLQKTIYISGDVNRKGGFPRSRHVLAGPSVFHDQRKNRPSDTRHNLEGKQDVFVKYLGVEV